jgi:hypothetical protein
MTDLLKLILGLLASLFKSRANLEAEVLILRQQINVLRRRMPKRLARSKSRDTSGHPDFRYTPWSAERRLAASKAARARIKAAKSNPKAKKKKTVADDRRR